MVQWEVLLDDLLINLVFFLKKNTKVISGIPSVDLAIEFLASGFLLLLYSIIICNLVTAFLSIAHAIVTYSLDILQTLQLSFTNRFQSFHKIVQELNRKSLS